MKQSVQLSYLRQLCTLAVPAPALVPAVITEMAAVLKLDMCCFNWVAADGTLSHAHTAGLVPPVASVERYTRHYVNRDEAELGITTRQRAHRPQVVSGSRDLGARFVNTILHNDILKPLHLRYILNAGVFAAGRLMGTIACNRMTDGKEFSQSDCRRLLAMLPYVALATEPRATIEHDWREEQEQGVLIIDARGVIQQADALGLNRLYRATRSTSGADAGAQSSLRAPLQVLAKRLQRIERGEPTPAPVLVLQAEGRRFRFTARALRSSMARPLQMLIVSAAEFVPAPLRLLPWLRAQGLSLRQRELCLQLLEGATLAEAARAMGVKQSTAQDYLDTVYAKLGVKSREALLVCLHTLPDPARSMSET